MLYEVITDGVSIVWAGPGALPGQAGAILIEGAHFYVVNVDIQSTTIGEAIIGQLELARTLESQCSIAADGA